MKGTWDSIHVIEVQDNKTKARYKLTSTVMLSIETETGATGQVNLAGSLTRQEEKESPVTAEKTHLVNIGTMIEDMEIKLRTTIELIYFGKTKDIANELRNIMGVAFMKQQKDLQQQIGSSLGKKN
jgi:capping protein beta